MRTPVWTLTAPLCRSKPPSLHGRRVVEAAGHIMLQNMQCFSLEGAAAPPTDLSRSRFALTLSLRPRFIRETAWVGRRYLDSCRRYAMTSSTSAGTTSSVSAASTRWRLSTTTPGRAAQCEPAACLSARFFALGSGMRLETTQSVAILAQEGVGIIGHTSPACRGSARGCRHGARRRVGETSSQAWRCARQ